MNEILKQISNFLGSKSHSLEAIILFITIFIAAWLIKEFRDTYSKEKETLHSNQMQMKEKLSRIKLFINLFEKNEIEMKELLEAIFELNAYLDYNRYKELKIILGKVDSSEFLEELDTFTTDLLEALMIQTKINIINDYSMVQFIEKFCRKCRDIVLPIIATLTVLFCAYVLLIIIASGKTLSWGFLRVYLLVFCLSFSLFFMNSLFSKKYSVKSKISLAILTVLFIPPMFFQNIYCLVITILGVFGVVLMQKSWKGYWMKS
ncbi:hypothetical protein BAMA_10310 [Bacillus manliponensis]|uniref:Uncharacterized protein n=1 Tax=Bacillus manliponensis TaxID=574376 RepID=A0A073JUH3_9BACI|nr:hypothetical protein [Bacillus manliponensis]KEK17877.1 hypothetical protein BAMA_10310 [Bacillus manliponensis]